MHAYSLSSWCVIFSTSHCSFLQWFAYDEWHWWLCSSGKLCLKLQYSLWRLDHSVKRNAYGICGIYISYSLRGIFGSDEALKYYVIFPICKCLLIAGKIICHTNRYKQDASWWKQSIEHFYLFVVWAFIGEQKIRILEIELIILKWSELASFGVY